VEYVAIDDLDFEIIRELVRDGRVTFSNLGARVGLSPHAAADRVRRLVKSGAILGFTAAVDPGHLGRHLDAMIDVRLRPETQPEHFEQEAMKLRCVEEVAFVTGRADYHVRVACRDADELDQVVRALRQRGGAASTETRIVMRTASALAGAGG
jgi:Lrp/AsnC family transcriptional regulator, leucine-responsive regulatory protein